MGTPHKHAAVIKAWAEGADIEYRKPHWHASRWESAPNPKWILDNEYRVKPAPHKWQKEMDAYAAGKIIQYRWNDPPGVVSSWRDCSSTPLWLTDKHAEYRIKPEREVWYGQAVKPNAGRVCLAGGFMSYKRLDEDDNLELTFEDGKLVDAKVLP